MTIDRRNRIFFEENADLYDQARPGYPNQLIQDVIEFSGLDPDGYILEIGCGPGNATLDFTRRGYCILAIELGRRMVELARKNCHPFPNVKFIQSSFEEWDLQKNTFDLSISADAFHWVVPEIGYPKVAQSLKDHGSAAFFWNVPVDPETEWSKEIDRIYNQITPELTNPDKAFQTSWMTDVIVANFRNSGLFGEVYTKTYSWSLQLDSERYIRLLRTYSGHRGIDESRKHILLWKIREVIERFGGQVDKPQQTILFHAPVKR